MTEATDRERDLAHALADYHDRLANEETVDAEEFCRRHPHIAAELRASLATLQQIDSLSTAETEPSAQRDSWDRPERLSGHKILGEIGSGGMGTVWLAVDERLGRKVAIKTLSSRFRNNAHLRERFMQEARAMARLAHPNIVHIYSLGQADEPPHFVMEYLDGVPLTEAAKALSLEQKIEIMHKMALAVDFLHRHQMVHRDLKPGNILVGPDLEPKLLDFGLARQMDDGGRRLTLAGAVVGTPNYFSPEQARADTPLDARSDIFSLGAVLYELLTGTVPFHAESFQEQVRQICNEHPVLPRRRNKSIPGDLQNICMKAMEKRPEDRYTSAREMADDLERFLAGEKVLAAPASYSNLMASKIQQHLRELEGWKQDHIISEYEYDDLQKNYGRLIEREDTWIMEVRRLSLPQVSLYLGAWLIVVGAALVFLFRYLGFSGSLAVMVVGVVTALTGYFGISLWKQERIRIAVAFLLAFCLLLPTTLLVAMGEYGILTGFSQGREDLEFFARLGGDLKKPTNAQMWWAIFLCMPVYLWLRKFTRSSVFSLVLAVMLALFSQVTLLRMGFLDWIKDDPGKAYFHMIPIALFFFVTGFVIERKKSPADSRYFYPFAVAYTFVAFSGVAAQHEPYREWLLSVAGWTRGQIAYLFIINAALYYVLQHICHAFDTSQMRTVAKVFRFVIPWHILYSIAVLFNNAYEKWQEGDIAFRSEARLFEVLLPAVACTIVFLSIPRQMKNYLASGLLFLATGIVILQNEWLEDRAEWPIALLVAGILLMMGASRYAALRMTLSRWFRRKT